MGTIAPVSFGLGRTRNLSVLRLDVDLAKMLILPVLSSNIQGRRICMIVIKCGLLDESAGLVRLRKIWKFTKEVQYV